MYELFKICSGDYQGGGCDNYCCVLTTNDREYAVREYHRRTGNVANDSWTRYELKERILP